MNLDKLHTFLDAMHRKDIQALAPYMTDDVLIRSPIVPEPFRGKTQVQAVLGHLLAVVDTFEVRELLRGDENVAVFLRMRMGDVEIDGVDVTHLDDNGLIDSMTVMWRPLPAVVAVQARIAPRLGLAALKLVADDAD